MSWFSSAIKFAAEALGFAAKRQDLNNAPDVREAAKQQNQQQALDERTKHVAEKDLDATRRDLGES